MKEKITFYTSTGEKICEVVMPVKDQWDWVSVLDKLAPYQLEQVQQSFISLYNKDYTSEKDAEYRITMEDIQDNDEFEGYLCDYFEIEYSGFCEYTPIEDEPVCKEDALTIRQLYELAKEKGMLDKPFLMSHYCSDDWYSITNVPITKNEIRFDSEIDAVIAEF